MTARKRLLYGIVLAILGAAIIIGQTQLANHEMEVQDYRNKMWLVEWAKEHPHQSRGVDVASYPLTALVGEFGGAVLVLTGFLVIRGGRKQPGAPNGDN